MAKVGKLSASKITLYKGCSLAYFLNHIQKEKTSDNVRKVFGKAIHYMLRRFYDVNYKSSETFAGYWRYYWFSTISGDFIRGKQKKELQIREFEIKKDKFLKVGSHVDLGPNPVGIFFGYMKLGEGILSRFYNRHKSQAPPLEKESSFGVKKDEPIEIGGHLVRGIFDRIDKKEGKFYITDYKTDKGSPETDSFVLHRHPQFTLYSYVFRKIFGAEENAILYYHLRTGNVFRTHRSERDYDYLRKLLDEVADGIEHDRFVPFYGFHCNFCDCRTACEKYSIPYHGGPRIDLEGKIIGAEKFKEWDIETPDWVEMQAEER